VAGIFEFQARTRVVFGDGSLDRAGELARELGFARTLVVSDHGVEQAGYVARALRSLGSAGVAAASFLEFDCNPDTAMVERGRLAAAEFECDSII
jgi:alcohol dehydrogenase